MRAETAGAKTWLLAATAGWALCLWALGLFGLGGRIVALPQDPSLLQRLPQPAPPLPERLGSLAQYGEIGARPLFTDNRRPQPFFINPDGESTKKNAFDYMLTSVLLTPRLQMAILQPSAGGESIRVKLGAAPDPAPQWVLSAVNPRSVVFNGPEGEKTLELRVFDGTGGQAPTPLSSPGQGTPRPPAGGSTMVPPPSIATGANEPPPDMSAKPPQNAPPAVPAFVTPEAQMEAIRKRIEARRAQLRQQNQPPASPGRKP